MGLTDPAERRTRSEGLEPKLWHHAASKLVCNVLDRLCQSRWVSVGGVAHVDAKVSSVYQKYQSEQLTVDTQASFSDVKGQVNASGVLDFGSGGAFGKPTSADIFGNSTGPFATGGNALTNAIIPRLAAGFNRSTLLLSSVTPNGTNASQYYTNEITNVRACEEVSWLMIMLIGRI